VFDSAGMRPDPAKVQLIRDWPPHRPSHDVRVFLRLASYYRRFVEGFAAVVVVVKVAQLNDLLSEGAPFEWGHSQRASFDAHKNTLCANHVLSYPVGDETFTVTTDASDLGLGAILEQGGRVLAYTSRALTPSEKDNSTNQKECLALVYVLTKFRHYLLGWRFVALTDHNLLVWLAKKKRGELGRDEPLPCRNMILTFNTNEVKAAPSLMSFIDDLQMHSRRTSSKFNRRASRRLSTNDNVGKVTKYFLFCSHRDYS